MSRYFQTTWIVLALSLTGCVSLPDNEQLYQEPPAPWEVEQNNNRLRDIDNLIQNGRNFVARQQAEVIKPNQLTIPQLSQYNLLYAQIFLSSGEAEQAISKLALVHSSQLSQADKIKFYQSQAFAFSLTGNLFASAQARISLDEFLTKPSERKNNQEIILETLGSLPEANIKSKQTQLPEMTAWISASKILASKNRNASEFNDSLARWRISNPKHPANFYLSTITRAPESLGAMPDSIAILLPESGPYADAAKAIKAGFMAAHSHYKNSRDNKPELHFYDTEKAKPSELYDRAVTSGAKLIVGPLNKENIKTLANNALLTVPVLALNHLPNLNKANLYQFALSPMDDAEEITKKAAADGHKKAIILAPDNELGKRVSAYINENWYALNGGVIEKQLYSSNMTDFSTGLKNLLKVNPSSNNLSADILFLAASTKEGRTINSALGSFDTHGLSVYALSNIFTGLTDPKNDASLNGITFCDAPWLFNGAYNGDLNMQALRDVWNKFPPTYIRLIAMGIDAYVLSAKLPTLMTTPYVGASGKLSLTSGNRIKRNLVCAKFVMGRPELTGATQPASTANPSATPAPMEVIIRGD